MHELAITESLVDAVTARLPGQRVTCVRLEIGELSGVVADSVRFCFDIVAAGTGLDGAALEITQLAAQCRCAGCGATFRPDGSVMLCPCGSADVAVLRGQELKIASVEVT